MGSKTKPVNEKFRVLTALGMIFVICGHYGIEAFSFGGLYPYESFHMPLFMFISGYFFKRENASTISAVLNYIIKKIKHLLIPYFAWNMVYGGVFIALTKLGFSNTESTPLNLHTLFVLPFLQAPGFSFNSAAWFVMALFFAEIVNCLIRYACTKAQVSHDWIWLLLYFTIAVASIVYSQLNYETVGELGIFRNLYLLFWYGFGTFYHNKLEPIDKRIPFGTAIICNVILTAALIFFVGSPATNVWSSLFDEPAFIVIARAALGIWFWVRIVDELMPVLGKSRELLFVGKHSFSYMMHQCITGMAINALILRLFPRVINEAMFKSNRWYAGDFGAARIIYLILILVIIACAITFVDKVGDYINGRMQKDAV